MAPSDDEQSTPQIGDITNLAARLVTPLHCAIGEEQGNARQDLLLVTLGEPDGSTDVLALLPEDAFKLRRMIAEFEADAEVWKPDGMYPRERFFKSSISRSERLVKSSGVGEYLDKLKNSNPALASYVEVQLASFSRSIRRHVASRRAACLLERRIGAAILTAIDFAMWKP
ncbi:MAG TPA: hypothetical protein VGN72_19930 [Tepidisphaeraceae bacterium]|jgi:hypothetical protein|nr:hypothetical protein [Tepidisphaeraceae bacterium]